MVLICDGIYDGLPEMQEVIRRRRGIASILLLFGCNIPSKCQSQMSL